MDTHLQKALTSVARRKPRFYGLNVVLVVLVVAMLSWNVLLLKGGHLGASGVKDEKEHSRTRREIVSPSRRQDVNSGPAVAASLFTRWGRTTCPPQTIKVYNGVAAGSYLNHAGGGSNYLCMPHDPIYAEYSTKVNNFGILYGSEYQMGVVTDNAPFSSQNARLLNDHNVPCAVCRVEKPTVLTLPGRNECYAGWQLMYEGYLMSGHISNKGRTQFVCVDADPEADESGYRNEDGANFYQVEGACGALPCPPYEAGRELTCAVCAK